MLNYENQFVFILDVLINRLLDFRGSLHLWWAFSRAFCLNGSPCLVFGPCFGFWCSGRGSCSKSQSHRQSNYQVPRSKNILFNFIHCINQLCYTQFVEVLVVKIQHNTAQHNTWLSTPEYLKLYFKSEDFSLSVSDSFYRR